MEVWPRSAEVSWNGDSCQADTRIYSQVVCVGMVSVSLKVPRRSLLKLSLVMGILLILTVPVSLTMCVHSLKESRQVGLASPLGVALSQGTFGQSLAGYGCVDGHYSKDVSTSREVVPVAPVCAPYVPSAGPSTVTPLVASTLVMGNNTRFPGNYLPTVWLNPISAVYDSAKGETFVADYSSPNVAVINDSTRSVVATVPVANINTRSLAYDSGKGEIFVAYENGNPSVSVISDVTNTVVANITIGWNTCGLTYDGNKGEVFAGNCSSGSHNVSVISDATDKVVTTIPIGAVPTAVAYDGGNGEVYVVNRGSNNVSVISDTTDKVVASIPVGRGPDAVAYDSNGLILVANAASNNVSEILGSNNKVVATISVGVNPWAVSYASSENEILVANSNSNDLSVISVASGKAVATVSVGVVPSGVAYDSRLGEAFVTNEGSCTMSVVLLSSNAVVATTTFELQPRSATYDSSKGEIFVSDYGTGNVSVVSATTNSVVATIPVGSNYSAAAAYDSVRGEVFVAIPSCVGLGAYSCNSGNVSVVSDSNNRVFANISVGTDPAGMAFDPTDDEVFVANLESNNVSVISDSTDKVVATVHVGTNPGAVAYDGGVDRIFVTNEGSDNVSVISGATDKVMTTIPVGSLPDAIAYDIGMNELFVANAISANVSIISDTTDTVTATVNVDAWPSAVAYDSVDGEVFVVNDDKHDLSVISDSTNTVSTTIQVGGYPVAAAYDSENGNIFVSNYGQDSLSIIFTTAVGPSPSITGFSPNHSSVVNGSSVTFFVNTTGGVGALAYAYTGLPPGCSTGNAATLPCVPTVLGSYTIRVYVNDTLGRSTTATTTLTVIAPIPPLTSVTVSPTSAPLAPDGSQTFTATPACSGTCTAVVSYSWTLTNHAMGTLNSSTSNPVKFSADNTLGTEAIFVNASSNGRTVGSSATIVIASSPTLTGVTVSPTVGSVPVGKDLFFNATVVCTSNPCPSGVNYAWTMNNTLGSVNTSKGPSTEFSAGSKAGMVALTMNASLNGGYRTSTVDITITPLSAPVLTGVILSPTSPTVQVGANRGFTATPVCSPGSCPLSGMTYAWSLTNGSMGRLNSTTGSAVMFDAGNTTGTVTIFVNATYSGVTVMSKTAINVSGGSSPSPSSNSMGMLLIMIVVIVVAVVALVATMLVMRKKGRLPPSPETPPAHATSPQPSVQLQSVQGPGATSPRPPELVHSM